MSSTDLSSLNPLPVVKVDGAGTVTYANDASGPVLAAWGCARGERVPEGVLRRILAPAEGPGVPPLVVDTGEETLRLSVVPASDGGCALFARDVSADRSEVELLRLLVELAPDAIILVDATGAITRVNAETERLFGYDRDELLDRSVELLLPEALREQHRAHRASFAGAPTRRAMGRGRSLPARHRDGHTFLADISLGPITVRGERMTCVALRESRAELRRQVRRSASELDATRAELSRAGELTLSLLDSVAEGVLVHDGEGRPYYANPQLIEILGKGVVAGASSSELSDVYGFYRAGTEELYPVEELPQVRALDGEVSRVTDVELRRGEARVPLWISAAPVYDEEGCVIHAIATVTDVTLQTRLQDQLRRSQKMEAVGRLAGGVAHDFNNLLTVMVSFAELARESLDEASPARADLDEVTEAAWRAESLTRQLLALSRKSASDPRPIVLNDVFRNMVKLLRRIVGDGIELAASFDEDLWTTHVDPGHMEQVVMNLAINARDAMPHGGKLTIETENVILDASYGQQKGVTVIEGEYVMFAITDNGCGMDERTCSKIFDPFFTTKSPGDGTGLGLSTCYGIVQQAGGYIWTYSEPGRGTTFKVYLPRHEGRAEATADRSTAAHLDCGGDETILLADNDEAVRSLAVRALEEAGYTVIAATDGAEALLLATQYDRPIDLFLTDVVMPNVSGLRSARRMKRLHPEARVLFMSGYTGKAIGQQGLAEDEEGRFLLQKPFTPQMLLTEVRGLLDKPRPSPSSDSPRLLLVDDDVANLAGWQRLFGQSYDVSVAAGAEAAVELLKLHDYDLVICEVNMPGMNGLDLLDLIDQRWPWIADRFAFLTDDVSGVVGSLAQQVGVSMLLKPLSLERVAALLDRHPLRGR